jgi:hypothetical protein
MRRLSLCLLTFFTGFWISANSQFAAGTRMAGVSVGSVFVNTGNADQTVTGIGSRLVKVNGFGASLVPSLGWFVSENTVVGGSFNLNVFNNKNIFEENGNTFQKDKTGSFDIGIGGFARNYFKSSGSVLPFGQISLSAGISSSNSEGFFYGGSGPTAYKETYDGDASGGFFGDAFLSAGITKMLGKYTGLDIYLGYNFHYTKTTTKTTTLHDVGIDGTIDETRTNETVSKFTNHRFIIGAGFQVFLEKKKK